MSKQEEAKLDREDTRPPGSLVLAFGHGPGQAAVSNYKLPWKL